MDSAYSAIQFAYKHFDRELARSLDQHLDNTVVKAQEIHECLNQIEDCKEAVHRQTMLLVLVKKPKTTMVLSLL
jgi:hypothetical protein